MKYLIIALSLMGTAQACEIRDEPHFFFRAGAGTTSLAPDGDLGAQLDLGYRWPTESGSIDIRIGDHSHWFVGEPFNNDSESSDYYLNIGYEFIW